MANKDDRKQPTGSPQPPEGPQPGSPKDERTQIEYEVLRDCFGFRGFLWKKGQRVTVEAGVKVPKHFHDTALPVPQEARMEKRRAINAKKVRRITKPGFAD